MFSTWSPVLKVPLALIAFALFSNLASPFQDRISAMRSFDRALSCRHIIKKTGQLIKIDWHVEEESPKKIWQKLISVMYEY